MKKIYIAIIAIMITASSTFSQAFWTVNYDMGLPSGDFAEFIPNYSWRGFSIAGNGYLTDNVLLGGTYSWSGFYDHLPRDTYELEAGAITAEVWKKAYINSFNFNASYIFIPEGRFQPYAGLGLGAYHVEHSTQAGLYASIPKNWKFGLSPQAGVYIPVGMSDWGFNLKAAYNNIFYNRDEIGNLGYFTFSAGVGFYVW